VIAPLSLIVSAFSPVVDVRLTLTPTLARDPEDTSLLFIDLANGKQRLGGSIFGQAFSQIGTEAPDFEDPALFQCFFKALQEGISQGQFLAYHDRSDGGLFTTLCEMSFAGHCGIDVDVSALGDSFHASLFNEELGAVIQVFVCCIFFPLLSLLVNLFLVYQVQTSDLTKVENLFAKHGFPKTSLFVVGKVTTKDQITVMHRGSKVFSETRISLQRTWSEVSYRMQSLRDNAQCAQQEFDSILDAMDPGLHSNLTFDLQALNGFVAPSSYPKVSFIFSFFTLLYFSFLFLLL